MVLHKGSTNVVRACSWHWIIIAAHRGSFKSRAQHWLIFHQINLPRFGWNFFLEELQITQEQLMKFCHDF